MYTLSTSILPPPPFQKKKRVHFHTSPQQKNQEKRDQQINCRQEKMTSKTSQPDI